MTFFVMVQYILEVYRLLPNLLFNLIRELICRAAINIWGLLLIANFRDSHRDNLQGSTVILSKENQIFNICLIYDIVLTDCIAVVDGDFVSMVTALSYTQITEILGVMC